MARPVIGDFRGAEQNKPRTASAPVTEEKKENSVTTAEEGADTTSPVAPLLKPSDFLTPAERYRERLKVMKIDLKEAESIYDGVLTKGYYEEYIRIRGSNRAVFRTRMYEDHLRLQTVLEMQKPQLALSQDELITRYNLSASLFEWNGKTLKHDNDADFDEVMKLVRRLPSPVFSLLQRELSKFDAKVMAVFEEGADENF
jgi:hypothetical protein